MTELESILTTGAAEMGVTLDARAIERLKIYADMLVEWNAHVNLTAITDEEGIAVKHFLDCLSPIPEGLIRGKVIDVGTGAGFPGLVLKAALPELELTLLDSLNKRVKFLSEVSAAMGFDDIEFIHARAEDCGNNRLYREQFDTVVTRAVANMTLLSELTLPFLKIGGRLAALKGPLAAEELDAAKRAIYILGGEVEEVKEVDIPHSDLHHKIVVVKKVRRTPSKYPRKPALISKSPIDTPYNKSQKYR